jgi:hypothetical protein
MGFDVSLIVYCDEVPLHLASPDQPSLDGCRRLLSALYPRTRFGEIGTVALDRGAFPDEDHFNVAAFDNGALIATRRAMLFNPSKLESRYLKLARWRTVYLLAQRSFYDMFAYGHWEQGQLRRAISVNPVGKVWESIGSPEHFELPFWNGEYEPPEPGYPLPFHPLDMADAALRSVLGAYFESAPGLGLVDPSTVALVAFRKTAAA